tara:strand:- start:854 stop:1057 length:204 start_codon:yes stop_codon:yes gene_type:complete
MLKKGQLVNWVEDYADGIAGKDFGTGIIIDSDNRKGYNSDSYMLYKVYRTKHKDFYWFVTQNLNIKK